MFMLRKALLKSLARRRLCFAIGTLGFGVDRRASGVRQGRFRPPTALGAKGSSPDTNALDSPDILRLNAPCNPICPRFLSVNQVLSAPDSPTAARAAWLLGLTSAGWWCVYPPFPPLTPHPHPHVLSSLTDRRHDARPCCAPSSVTSAVWGIGGGGSGGDDDDDGG